jgi:hypothetical protein
MEPREIVAYSLSAILAFVILAGLLRYRHNRKQFKLRQTGKNKSVSTREGTSRN